MSKFCRLSKMAAKRWLAGCCIPMRSFSGFRTSRQPSKPAIQHRSGLRRVSIRAANFRRRIHLTHGRSACRNSQSIFRFTSQPSSQSSTSTFPAYSG